MMENQYFFGFSNQLIKVDYFARRAVVQLTDDTIDLHTQLNLSLAYPSLSASEQPAALAKMKSFDDNLKEALETQDYTQYLIFGEYAMKAQIQISLSDYLTTKFLSSVSSTSFEKLKGPSTEVEIEGTIISMKSSEYVRNLYVRLQVPLDYMTFIRPITANKEPPFALTTPESAKIVEDYLQTTISIIRISYDKIFAIQYNILENVVEKILESQSTSYQRAFWILNILLIGSLIMFCVADFFSMKYLNTHLITLLSLYECIKPEELLLQQQIINSNIIRLRQCEFNEPKLIEYYTERVKVPTESMTSLNSHQRGKSKSITGGNLHSNVKKSSNIRFIQLVRISKDFTFKTVRIGYFFLVIIMGLFLSVIILLNQTSQMLMRNFKIERLYFETYLRYIPVSNNYLSFINLLVFGNFVLIDGKLAEDFKDDDTIVNFNRLCIDRVFSEYLSSDQNKIIEEVLFGDICKQLKDQTKDIPTAMIMCQKYIPSAKGLTSILTAEFQELKTKRQEIRDSQPAYLAASKLNFIESPNLEYLFTKDTIRMRRIHETGIHAYFTPLFDIIGEVLEASFENTKKNVKAIWVSLGVINAVLLFLYFYSSIKKFSSEVDICVEFFWIIHPQVIFKNMMVQRWLDQFYTIEKR